MEGPDTSTDREETESRGQVGMVGGLFHEYICLDHFLTTSL